MSGRFSKISPISLNNDAMGRSPKERLKAHKKSYARNHTVKHVPGWIPPKFDGQVQLTLGINKPYTVNYRYEINKQPKFIDSPAKPNIRLPSLSQKKSLKNTEKFALRLSEFKLDFFSETRKRNLPADFRHFLYDKRRFRSARQFTDDSGNYHNSFISHDCICPNLPETNFADFRRVQSQENLYTSFDHDIDLECRIPQEIAEAFANRLDEAIHGKFNEDFQGNLDKDFQGKLGEDFQDKLDKDFQGKLGEDFQGKLGEDFQDKLDKDFYNGLNEGFQHELNEKSKGELGENFQEEVNFGSEYSNPNEYKDGDGYNSRIKTIDKNQDKYESQSETQSEQKELKSLHNGTFISQSYDGVSRSYDTHKTEHTNQESREEKAKAAHSSYSHHMFDDSVHEIENLRGLSFQHENSRKSKKAQRTNILKRNSEIYPSENSQTSGPGTNFEGENEFENTKSLSSEAIDSFDDQSENRLASNNILIQYSEDFMGQITERNEEQEEEDTVNTESSQEIYTKRNSEEISNLDEESDLDSQYDYSSNMFYRPGHKKNTGKYQKPVGSSIRSKKKTKSNKEDRRLTDKSGVNENSDRLIVSPRLINFNPLPSGQKHERQKFSGKINKSLQSKSRSGSNKYRKARKTEKPISSSKMFDFSSCQSSNSNSRLSKIPSPAVDFQSIHPNKKKELASMNGISLKIPLMNSQGKPLEYTDALETPYYHDTNKKALQGELSKRSEIKETSKKTLNKFRKTKDISGLHHDSPLNAFFHNFSLYLYKVISLSIINDKVGKDQLPRKKVSKVYRNLTRMQMIRDFQAKSRSPRAMKFKSNHLDNSRKHQLIITPKSNKSPRSHLKSHRSSSINSDSYEISETEMSESEESFDNYFATDKSLSKYDILRMSLSYEMKHMELINKITSFVSPGDSDGSEIDQEQNDVSKELTDLFKEKNFQFPQIQISKKPLKEITIPKKEVIVNDEEIPSYPDLKNFEAYTNKHRFVSQSLPKHKNSVFSCVDEDQPHYEETRSNRIHEIRQKMRRDTAASERKILPVVRVGGKPKLTFSNLDKNNINLKNMPRKKKLTQIVNQNQDYEERIYCRIKGTDRLTKRPTKSYSIKGTDNIFRTLNQIGSR